MQTFTAAYPVHLLHPSGIPIFSFVTVHIDLHVVVVSLICVIFRLK